MHALLEKIIKMRTLDTLGKARETECNRMTRQKGKSYYYIRRYSLKFIGNDDVRLTAEI